MQRHKQLPIDETFSDLIPCRSHPKKQLEYWCYTCVTVICIDCLLFQHKEHRYGIIADVVKEFQEKVSRDLSDGML